MDGHCQPGTICNKMTGRCESKECPSFVEHGFLSVGAGQGANIICDDGYLTSVDMQTNILAMWYVQSLVNSLIRVLFIFGYALIKIRTNWFTVLHFFFYFKWHGRAMGGRKQW